MKTSKKLVFFGNERLATGVITTAPTLQALVSAGYDVAAVIASFSPGIGRSARNLEVADLAQRYDIPVLLPEKVDDIVSEIRRLQPEIGVLVAFGQIIPQAVIDIFPKGIVNIHPSLLPKYRGPTPIEAAILDGLETTGVSLMSLVSKMDAGPIYAQAKIAIDKNDTKQSLANKLLLSGSRIMLEELPGILDGTTFGINQDDSAASYSFRINKADGRISWQDSPESIKRKVLAYAGWPKARATIFDKEVVILEARVARNKSDGDLVIECRGGFLEILRLTAPSGRNLSGAEFIRGYSPRS